MGIRHPTAFSRGQRRRRTRLGSRSARRRKDLGRNKILKNENKEIKLSIQQAIKNESVLNGQSSGCVSSPVEAQENTGKIKKQEKTTLFIKIFGWLKKILTNKNRRKRI